MHARLIKVVNLVNQLNIYIQAFHMMFRTQLI